MLILPLNYASIKTWKNKQKAKVKVNNWNVGEKVPSWQENKLIIPNILILAVIKRLRLKWY